MNTTLIEDFKDLYGSTPRLFRAPGRVNLIGEHTDYNDGFVMPCALSFCTTVAASEREDRSLVVRSSGFNEEVFFSLDDTCPAPSSHWSDYVRGVAVAAQARGLSLRGTTLLVDGDVPLGAGLSSSASLEVAVALALLATADLQLPPSEVALLCQHAENSFVGMKCGVMDQFISACGRAGHAMLLDCRSLATRHLPIPARARIVICNSMVRHELTGGEYNERRESCEEGARLLGLRALRDATLEQVESLDEPVLRRRCRHVVSENERVQRAAQALLEEDLELFGRLMGESHRSLRDDFKVSCSELDRLVELAEGLEGVYGARMTGGGFGGCTVNLVRREEVSRVLEHLKAGYPEGEFYVCDPCEGACEILEGSAA